MRGVWKAQIDTLLRILLFVLVGVAFVVGGWKPGLLSIPIAFLSAVITRPFAARTAAKLYAAQTGERSTRFVGLPSREFQRISKQLGRLLGPKRIFDEVQADRDSRAETTLLDYCESQPEVRTAMNEFHVSRDDLWKLYKQLIDAGAGQWICGHWVPASALAYPEALRYMLIRRGQDMEETAYNVCMYFERGSVLEI